MRVGRDGFGSYATHHTWDVTFDTRSQRFSTPTDDADATERDPAGMDRAALAVVFSGVVLFGCGGTTATSAARSPAPTVQNQAASPAPSSPAATLYTLASEPGSSISGTVQVAKASDGVTLTATVSGLVAGHSYIVDADPLPCMFFVGGPSQAFAKALEPDASGRATAVWTIPTGMNGSASVQALSGNGTFAVVACADLTP